MTTGDGTPSGHSPDRAADVARARLARALRESGHTPSAAVQAAFQAVPRHLFVPELDPAVAYQDEALVIKYGDDGLPISSSSQPAMMAIMLEQLRLRPGHRVLEIGTGTGYNAAVMAHIVGPEGAVVTVDIDADLIARARAGLAEAGYGQVRTICADGGYGDPQDAPFDRIIVTAGASDIAPAWLDQVGPGGRLVLPLSVRGIQLSLSLERAAGADSWIATSAFRCGFVRMLGAFAEAPFRPLGLAPGLYVQADDEREVDLDELAMALSGPASDAGTGVRARGRDELADLDLWLTLTQPALARLTIMETATSRAQVGPLLPFGGLAGPASPEPSGPPDLPGLGIGGLVGVRTARAALPGSGPRPALEQRGYPGEIVLRGYGPGGRVLAGYLGRQVSAWDRLGRPGAASLTLTAWPATAELIPPPGQILLRRPHIRVAAGWTPGPRPT